VRFGVIALLIVQVLAGGGGTGTAGTIVGNNSSLRLSVSGDSSALKTTADINTCDGSASENRTVG
jgi:hypothetical protein